MLSRMKRWVLVSFFLQGAFRIAPLPAAEIQQTPYQFSPEAGAVIERADTFVICECPPSSPLSVKPREIPLSLKMTESSPASVPVQDVREEPLVGEEANSRPKKEDGQTEVSSAAPVPPSWATMSVYFDPEASDLKESERDKLLQSLPRLKQASARIQVSGYTDDLGPTEYNELLSLNRARRVAELLRENGLPVEEILGKGSCCPVSSDRELNRRVEISAIKGGVKP